MPEAETREALAACAAPVDFGDLVLRDGAPVAVAEIGGRPVPRFPLLEILRRGIVYGKMAVPATVELHRVRELVERAMRTRGTFQLAVPELYEQLGDTQRAGQEHQAWRGIERVAIRKGLCP